jgi:hypothetical protein
MINGVYLDMDEMLISSITATSLAKCPADCIDLDFGNERYFTRVRPTAKELIQFCRETVGAENVFILTNATLDYASRLNDLAGFGFLYHQVITREDWGHWNRYYASQTPYKNADWRNILIDNEDYFEKNASGKMLYLNIDRERYLKVRPYLGYTLPETEEKFLEQCKQFILEKNV